MHSKTFDSALKIIEIGKKRLDALDDAFDLARMLRMEDSCEVDDEIIYNQDNFKDSMELSKLIRTECAKWIKITGEQYAVDLYEKTLLFEAPYDFDCYCRYLEWNREPRKRFYEPRRKQLKPIVDSLQDLAENKIDLLAISMPPGTGKALANDTPILTRNGWKNHGDLSVGDEVIGLDGHFKKVIAVHQKCMLDCLVEFTNGEKIQCHENHEWLVHDRARNSENDYIVETKLLEKRTLQYGGDVGHRGHRYVIQLPKHGYVVGEEKELPLDPYTLGAWLGDGTNTNPTVCSSLKDKCVIDRIVKNGIRIKWNTVHKTTGVLYFGFDMRKNLRKLGMCHSKKRISKRIPEEYLTASISQRLELLAGLIDTDGTKVENKYRFTTTEETLRDTFIELISTFGWRSCVVQTDPLVSSSGVAGRKAYYVIQFTPDCIIPCEIERKRMNSFHQQRFIGFKSITRTEPKEGNCITVEGDGMYLAGKTMIPTHNTTIAIFYLTWIGGRNPELSVLGGSHSNSFLRGVYDEIERILNKDGEYNYNKVFPHSPLVRTNSKDLRLDLEKSKRFETFEFSSIGSGNAGKVRASRLLYCDDLVDGIETAMSADRLDKLWQQYYTDLRQRKIGNCQELHIATRWSVRDPIGRLQMQYEDDPRARFLAFPALDENDESNFDYPYSLGFTTDFYRKQRDIMDDVSWRCLYMNEPIEREGTLYHPDELRRYFDLPKEDPDAIIAVCDTKDQGPDYCVMPIAYRYGDDFYIEYILCDNGKPEMIEERLVSELVAHNVKNCQFESNRGAGRVAESIQKRIRERGGFTRITTKWSQSNKEARIIAESPYIKQHCLFKDESMYTKEYRTAMSMLCGWTMSGRNKHDDVPDAFSMLSDYIQNVESGRVTLMQRIF